MYIVAAKKLTFGLKNSYTNLFQACHLDGWSSNEVLRVRALEALKIGGPPPFYLIFELLLSYWHLWPFSLFYIKT